MLHLAPVDARGGMVSSLLHILIITPVILSTPWHVINVMHRVWANAARYEYSKQKCEICGRHRFVGGIFNFQSDVAIPTSSRTFFAPTFNRGG